MEVIELGAGLHLAPLTKRKATQEKKLLASRVKIVSPFYYFIGQFLLYGRGTFTGRIFKIKLTEI